MKFFLPTLLFGISTTVSLLAGNEPFPVPQNTAIQSPVPLVSPEITSTATPASDPAFWQWAPTPPMGWNSWDCFATTITERQALEQADVMAARLLPHGWKYLVVDHQWFEPGAGGFNYRKRPELVMDGYGRLQPALNRFPSASDGKGFKPLADAIHSKGLKFGIHIMRGIPRQAVEKNTPILGTPYHAAEIADTNSTCHWNDDMYGVDMSKPGAQEFYDSRISQYAEWGVDFIKVDDLSRPYHKAEIEAIRRAIDKTDRQIVFSTSPGETPVAEGGSIERNANMWRISDDFWDSWKLLKEQFRRLDAWTPYRGTGHFPDADMLPLGAIRQVKSSKDSGTTHFSKDEQITLMTLWAIARSPLILGGDMTKLDDFTLSLLTNDAVLAVNQHSINNRQLFNHDGLIAWIADIPQSKEKYLALFNTTEAPVSISLKGILALGGSISFHNLWDSTQSNDSVDIPVHGANLYRLTPN